MARLSHLDMIYCDKLITLSWQIYRCFSYMNVMKHDVLGFFVLYMYTVTVSKTVDIYCLTSRLFYIFLLG